MVSQPLEATLVINFTREAASRINRSGITRGRPSYHPAWANVPKFIQKCLVLVISSVRNARDETTSVFAEVDGGSGVKQR